MTFLYPSLGANYTPAAIGLVGAGLLGYLTSYRALEYGGAVGRRQLLGVTLIIPGLVMIGLS